MSKNKFFKKLLVAGLCALTATATVGTVVTVAGCKKDKGEEEQQQTQKYTVTFNLDGGNWSNPNSVEITAGGKVTKPSNPSKTGYTFSKWIDPSDGSEYDFNAVVESDLTLKAVWTPVQQGGEQATTYTVTINLDGGDWGDNSLSIEVAKDGTLGDALQDAEVTANPTKTGYTFAGWITEGGDDYDTDTPVTEDITIKAKWTAAHQHTWAEEWQKDADGHYKKANCNDNAECETAKTQEGAHVDANGDNECDTCGYAETTLPAGYTALKNKIGTDENVSVIDNTFIVAGKLNKWSGTWGTKGVYYDRNDKDNATDETNYVTVTGGVATQVDANGASSVTVVDLGAMTGVVEGYCDFTFASQKNSWTPIQLYGISTAKVEVGEVFGLRIDGGKIKYRVNGGSVTAGTNTPDSANKKYGLYFKVDLLEGKVTVKVDDTVIVENLAIDGLSDFAGVRFTSSDGDAALVHVDNLIVVNKPASLADYKTVIGAKYAAVNEYVGELGLELTEAQATYTAAMAAATENADCDDAYDGYYATVLGLMKTALINGMSTEYPAANYTTNATEYATAKTDGEAAVNAAKTLEKVMDAGEEWVTAIMAIHPDSYYDKADVKITISDGTNEIGNGVTKKEGDTVTLDDLTNAVSLTATQKVTFYETYNAGTYSDEITGDITLSAAKTIYAKIEVKSVGEGHYIIRVKEGVADLSAGDALPSGASVTYASNNGATTSANSGDFKFDGGNAVVTITLKVTVGQTITVKVSGFSGSSNNAVDVKCTATGATLTSGAGTDTVGFAADSTVNNQGSGTMTYSATADTVVLQFKRSIGKTTRVTEFDITVA